MKTSKKILAILTSLTVVSGIAALISTGGSMLFGLPFWGIFTLVSALQLIVPSIVDGLYAKYILKKNIDEYNNKPYKQYPIKTACQHCGNLAVLNLDLDDTEYVCGNCHKHNAVHVTFMTAAIQTPVNTQVL